MSLTTMLLPDTQTELAASFTRFLTVAIHQIIYLRSVYPRVTFLPVRAYDFPLRQSRHPKVCDYINDVAAAVETEILKGTVAAAYVVITSVSSNQPMERFAFDLSEFPRVAEEDICTTFEERHNAASRLPTALSVADIEAQFRACLSRLISACERLAPLPADDEFGFTVCIEVREDALPPAGTTKAEEKWIVAEPGQVNLQSRSAPKDGKQRLQQQPSQRISSEKAKTVPVRRVEAGELRFELWVEEARQKFEKRSDS